MAKRKQLWHPDEVRQKIQASQLINRLTKNALSESGEIMTASQVQSARILLDKAIPNLATTNLNHGTQPDDPIAALFAAVAEHGKRISQD